MGDLPFGPIADQYDRHRPAPPEGLLDDLERLGGSVLDVGCGTGKAAVALAERGLTVLGLEPDPQMAAIARGHGVPVEIGAFETWDVLGVKATSDKMKEAGYAAAPWVSDMLAAGIDTFYKVDSGKRLFYDIPSKSYKPVPGGEAFIVMRNFEHQTVWSNSACRLYHLGDDVLGLE